MGALSSTPMVYIFIQVIESDFTRSFDFSLYIYILFIIVLVYVFVILLWFDLDTKFL